MDEATVSGINLANLREAFEGSEDVLEQMLGLFLVQAAERMQQLDEHLGAWDVAATRTVLHSLVNISGAVRAYAMSDLAKSVGASVKREDRDQAQAVARALAREAALVIAQAKALIEAAKGDPPSMWKASLPTA